MTKKKSPFNETEAIKNPRFKVQFTFDVHEGKQMDTDTIKTQPDMSLTVQQLLLNHTRGAQNPMEKEPLYFEMTVPTLKDITDVQQYRDYLKEKVQKVDQWIKDDKQKAEAKRQKAAEAKLKQLRVDEEAERLSKSKKD